MWTADKWRDYELCDASLPSIAIIIGESFSLFSIKPFMIENRFSLLIFIFLRNDFFNIFEN